MLALVALVEAGQRSRYEDPENQLGYGKSSPYDLPQQDESFDWYSPWADSAEYYGMPYENLDSISRYEALKENRQNGNGIYYFNPKVSLFSLVGGTF